MPSEVARIRSLLARTYEGDAWHGPSVCTVLDALSASQALRLINNSHNAAELVHHMTAWRNFVIQRLTGDAAYELSEAQDWSVISQLTDAHWQEARRALDQSQQKLLDLLEHLPEAHLDKTVAYRSYNYYILLHGSIHHDLYHLGQIRLLAKFC